VPYIFLLIYLISNPSRPKALLYLSRSETSAVVVEFGIEVFSNLALSITSSTT